MFSVYRYIVKDNNYPSKYFPSNIWRVSIRQNFALYGTSFKFYGKHEKHNNYIKYQDSRSCVSGHVVHKCVTGTTNLPFSKLWCNYHWQSKVLITLKLQRELNVNMHLLCNVNACCRVRCSWLMCIEVKMECCKMWSILFQRSMQKWTAKQLNSKEGSLSFVKRLKKVDFQLKGWP